MLTNTEIKNLTDMLRPYYIEFAKVQVEDSKKITWLLFQQECEKICYADLVKIADKL